MYTIDTEVLKPSSTQTYISSGIENNVELSARADISTSGKPYLELMYINDSNQNVKRTEWEVNALPIVAECSPKQKDMLVTIAERNGNVPLEEAREIWLKNKQRAQMSRIIYAASFVVPEEELKGLSFNTFNEFVTFVANKINERSKGVKLRVKFVYDNKGYVNTPDYVSSTTPWIESMTVSEEDSKIKILPNDVMVRTQPAGISAPRTTSPLETSTGQAVTGDMPF